MRNVAPRLLFVVAGDPDTWTKPERFPDDLPRPDRLRGHFRHDADQVFVHAVITRNGGPELPAGAEEGNNRRFLCNRCSAAIVQYA